MRKVCPVVLRPGARCLLAFTHPLEGHQLVKGTLELGEAAVAGALRELAEESGIRIAWAVEELGEHILGTERWTFVLCATPPVPDRWSHWCTDDGGLRFRFFWHPLDDVAPPGWHPLFHAALAIIRRELTTRPQLHPNAPSST